MTWDPTGVWVMLAVACAIGVVGATRARFGVAGRPRLRAAPLPFLGACIDALLTGLGVGMLAVLLILTVGEAFRALGL